MNFDSIPSQNKELIENDYIQKKSRLSSII